MFNLFILPLFLLSQNSPPTISCDIPVQLNLLTEINSPSEVITANSFSPNSLTLPSLWWPEKQFDDYGGLLVYNWLAYPRQKRVDLIVNPQLWNIMDYISRYRFVHNFGTVARSYNYNLRVFSQNQKCLALYYYNQENNPPKWELDLTPLAGTSGVIYQ